MKNNGPVYNLTTEKINFPIDDRVAIDPEGHMKWCQGRLCASTLDQIASAALYSVGPEYFDAVRKEYKARKETLTEGLKKTRYRLFRTEGRILRDGGSAG